MSDTCGRLNTQAFEALGALMHSHSFVCSILWWSQFVCKEYDKFCDVDFRRDLSGVDCEAESESCPEETHPCYHTYDKKIDENNWWTLTQRDIDRDYVKGIADVSQAYFDADIAEFEQWVDVAELILTVAAGAAAAAAPGSYATPAEESAESGSEANENAGKAAQETRARSSAVAGPAAQQQLRSFQRFQKIQVACPGVVVFLRSSLMFSYVFCM